MGRIKRGEEKIKLDMTVRVAKALQCNIFEPNEKGRAMRCIAGKTDI